LNCGTRIRRQWIQAAFHKSRSTKLELEFTTLMARHGPGAYCHATENWSDVMNKLRRSAIAVLAAATVTVSSLAIPATASAMPMSCTVRKQLALSYYATGQVFYALGDDANAYFWWGKAYGIVEGC
jgi:hypothetical protein